jgi:predicted PurR-regulated permease PerM
MSSQQGGGEPRAETPLWVRSVINRSVWTLVGAVLLVLALLWFAFRARELIRILVLAQLFAFALEPAVTWLSEHRGWRRGAAAGAILAATIAAFLVLVILVIPPLARGVNGIVRATPGWIDELNAFGRRHFHTVLVSVSGRTGSATAIENVSAYLKEHAGQLLGAAGGLLGAVFNVFAVGLFTFFLAAKGPEVRRALLSRMPPARQERVLFAINEAIRKMGGYLYSNLLLSVINGTLLLITLLLVGCPFALPIAMFSGVVAEFIPLVGTYVAAVVPVTVTLAEVGVGGALIVLAELVVYQAVENYWLSPRVSQKTMQLNAGIAFGAAMAGGAVGGFVGAFFALPVAAVVQSFIATYSRRYEVTESALTRMPEPGRSRGPGLRRRRRANPRAGALRDGEVPPPGDASGTPPG